MVATYPLVPLIETTRVQLSLRIVSPDTCPLAPYGTATHNAQLPWREVRTVETVEYAAPDPKYPLWPSYCRCGVQFRSTDLRLVVPERLYRWGSEGELTTLREAPVGACWDATWMPQIERLNVLWRGPDARCLVIQTPAGEWWVDGPSQQVPHGRGWSRTGVTATMTCTPGVVFPTWSGYVQDGVLYTGVAE
jgi:hypothetical protein